jgi:hypothetical protein
MPFFVEARLTMFSGCAGEHGAYFVFFTSHSTLIFDVGAEYNEKNGKKLP